MTKVNVLQVGYYTGRGFKNTVTIAHITSNNENYTITTSNWRKCKKQLKLKNLLDEVVSIEKRHLNSQISKCQILNWLTNQNLESFRGHFGLPI